jgi:hypothetical protein
MIAAPEYPLTKTEYGANEQGTPVPIRLDRLAFDEKSSNLAASSADGLPFVIIDQARFYAANFGTPFSNTRTENLEAVFNRLANEWKSAVTGPSSSITRIVTHPAYLEIISHGEKMLPYVLRDLQKSPNHWFVALFIMAGRISPVRPEDSGDIQKMTLAWLEWGKKNGKLV